MAKETLIELQNIHTQFGKQIIHDKLNLEIFQGEILGIVGGSGSGKSLLLRIIAGLDAPHKGRIIYKKPELQVGMLFQQGALISSLTVLENIAVPLIEMAKVSEALAQEIALAKLQHVGLDKEAGQKYPSQLSGGMIKRVGIARALALDPEVVLLDEPTAGLDPIAAASFDDLILELHQKLGITVILVTHDLDTLARICHRIAVLVDRRVIAGKIEDITQLDHPWIKEYFLGVRGKRLFGKAYGT